MRDIGKRGWATVAASAVAVAVGLTTAGVSAVSAEAAEAGSGKIKLGGGSSIVFAHNTPIKDKQGGTCTLTAVGTDAKGNVIGLTNAHCFYDTKGNQFPGDKIYADETKPGNAFKPQETADPDLKRGVLGTVVFISGGNPVVPGPNGPGLDYSVIKFDKSKVAPTNTVGSTTIKRYGPPPGTGARMCKQGRTTGLTCGFKVSNNGNYFTHTIYEAPGDSGSPVVFNGTLVGNQWVAGGSTSIVPIMKDLNTRGKEGAGFKLPTTS